MAQRDIAGEHPMNSSRRIRFLLNTGQAHYRRLIETIPALLKQPEVQKVP
jgi:hypothetical protein